MVGRVGAEGMEGRRVQVHKLPNHCPGVQLLKCIIGKRLFRPHAFAFFPSFWIPTGFAFACRPEKKIQFTRVKTMCKQTTTTAPGTQRNEKKGKSDRMNLLLESPGTHHLDPIQSKCLQPLRDCWANKNTQNWGQISAKSTRIRAPPLLAQILKFPPLFIQTLQ